MTAADEAARPSPRLGRPPRISRAQIIATARRIPPETLTMQAVATELGVDRSTVNYHVPDRRSLLELVAADVFASEVSTLDLPATGNWRDTVRALARQVRTAMVRAGAFSPYFPMSLSVDGQGPLEQLERAVRELVESGLSETDVGHALTMLSQLAAASARDVTLTDQQRGHPQLPEVQRVLDEQPPTDLPGLRALMSAWDPASDTQFEFDLDVFVAGVERLIDRSRRA